MPPLTQKDVRAFLGLDANGRVVRKWDGDGLYMEMLPKGPKRWMYKFALHGRERRMSLGPLSSVSLKEAREARDECRRLIRQGDDPIAKRKDERRNREQAAAITIKRVADEWMAQQTEWTADYRDDVERSFERHVYPALERVPLADVTPAMLLRLVIGPLVANGRQETARRLRQRLDLIWNHAILMEYTRGGNPAQPLKGKISAPSVTHFASAKEQELPALLVAVRAYGNRLVEHAVLLQLLTATRPGETRGARWEEFDWNRREWAIPAERMKRRREHIVPLSAQAVDVLRSLQGLTGTGPVLFPSRSRHDAPMSANAALMVFERSGFGHVTAHGFRSLFSTTCHEHGHESHIIEACMAHLDKNPIRATYNKAQYLPQRRELLQWWGDHLQALCKVHADTHAIKPALPVGVA